VRVVSTANVLKARMEFLRSTTMRKRKSENLPNPKIVRAHLEVRVSCWEVCEGGSPARMRKPA
jgi:hypothetical protein